MDSALVNAERQASIFGSRLKHTRKVMEEAVDHFNNGDTMYARQLLEEEIDDINNLLEDPDQ